MNEIKKYTYWFLLSIFSIIGLWLIPSFVKKATVEPSDYPFLYYSSVAKELCIIDYKNKKAPVKEITGKTYNSVAQADSVLPLFKYRQLLSEGRFPDSINGQEVSVRALRSQSVFYRISPSDIGAPVNGLYIMYESMPKRLGFESPGDVFRLKNSIEFIDIKSNTVNKEKSDLFQKALVKHGFKFPAQWVNGNMNPRKPYDEGYFVLDNEGQLFQIKMVNSRPFVRNTQISDSVNVAWFDMSEASDRRFYGFIYDKAGGVYIIGNDSGKYDLTKLDIKALDLKNDHLYILGNIFYWTVRVTTKTGQDYYGLQKDNLKCLSTYHVEKTADNWDKLSEWLFPVYLTFDSRNSDYIYPRIHTTGLYAILGNILLALLFLAFYKKNSSLKITQSFWIAVWGIAGLIAVLLLPRSNR